jgi:hypothetical protein
MPSTFAYYRPRGVKGNFIVAIVLDLLETETATVNVARQRGTNCGHCGVQTPRIERNEVNPARRMDEGQERRWELYRIDQLIVGDSLTIRIQDKDVIPYQETCYQAAFQSCSEYNKYCQDGFTTREQPFRMNNVGFGIIALNPINVIDWDKVSSTSVEEQPDTVRIRDLLLKQPQQHDTETTTMAEAFRKVSQNGRMHL